MAASSEKSARSTHQRTFLSLISPKSSGSVPYADSDGSAPSRWGAARVSGPGPGILRDVFSFSSVDSLMFDGSRALLAIDQFAGQDMPKNSKATGNLARTRHW